MKVFLSWSNTLSHTVAKYFSEWLPGVIQECAEPFISSETSKGDPWFETITANLESTNIGIVFITRENMNASWLNFEAGAMLNKFGKSGICPLLVGLKKGDYVGPLKNLQLTEIEDKADMFLMMETLNGRCVKPLETRVLQRAFDQSWAELVEAVTDAAESAKKDLKPSPRGRTQEEKIEEILTLVRRIPSLELTSISMESDSELRSARKRTVSHQAARAEKLADFEDRFGSVNGFGVADRRSFIVKNFIEKDGVVRRILVQYPDETGLKELEAGEFEIVPF